jgi:exodeoxyribonuclease VII small subunit
MPSKSKPSRETLIFESAIVKIEAITARLEREDTNLDESLASFEEGITLTRDAQHILAAAEQKLKILLEENGKSVAVQTPDFEGLK